MRILLSTQNQKTVSLELTPEQAEILGLGEGPAGQAMQVTLTTQPQDVRPELLEQLESLLDEQAGLYERLSNA